LPIVVSTRIPRGWHLYGLRQPADGPLATRVEVGPEPPFTLASPVTESDAAAAFDPNFGVVVEWHDDSASFRVPLRAARATLPGTYDAQVRVSYQRCNDRICLPLRTDTLTLALSIAGAPVADESPGSQATSAPPQSPRSASPPPQESAAPPPAANPTQPRVDTLRTTSPVPVEVPEPPPEQPPAATGAGRSTILLLGLVVVALAAVLLFRSSRRSQ